MRIWITAIAAGLAIVAFTYLAITRTSPRTHGPLPSEAYVWQRQWTPAVRDAARLADPKISRLVVLVAEISWQRDRPSVTRVDVDWSSLAGKPYAVAIRINAVDPAKIAPTEVAQLLANLLRELPAPPAELQIDFDCPESKLGAYADWLAAAQATCAPAPVTITALPSWLKRSDFSLLAKRCNYVLQVHSLHRPTTIAGHGSLLDPAEASEAVEQAGRLGFPFRVALPTYSCVALFDRQGKFLRIFSENLGLFPAAAAPAMQTWLLRSDPGQVASLVRHWQHDRPAAMTGLVWYRLPTADDSLNWRWPTLAAVMAGRRPTSRIAVHADRDPAGTVELSIANEGDDDAPLPARIALDWPGGIGSEAIASDGVGGYSVLDESAGTLTLTLASDDIGLPPRIFPGQRRAVGWLRLTKDTEVRGHVLSNP